MISVRSSCRRLIMSLGCIAVETPAAWVTATDRNDKVSRCGR